MHIDRAGAEEQGDLANGVHDDVHRGARDASGGSKHGAQHHIAKLTNGRVGQPRLEVVLAHGDEGGEGQGECRDPHNKVAGAGLGKEVDSQYIDHDLGNGEDTGFDHSHRMQQRADGCWCNHGTWQPAVKRHQGGLADTKGEQRHQPW